MIAHPNLRHRASSGFTLMEVLVVVAIILVLAVITMPVLNVIRQRQFKAVALQNMRNLGAAAGNFSAQNDGLLPAEDAKGTDTWTAAADPINKDAWYNALLKQMGNKTVGEYAKTPREFYTKSNILWLPGATYPEGDKKLTRPLFAIAINTKLQRKNEDGKKAPLRLANLESASRTVLFLEQGLPSEKKSLPVQAKYDGTPKGSARSFVGRYSGQGVITFCDGHSEVVEAKDLLTETGRFPFPPDDMIWTRSRDEDPNK